MTATPPAATRSARGPMTLYRWWRTSIVREIDHRSVVERVVQDSGWSGRYAFMTMMSAGIAVLGLLLSSPAVVIGAMLISPLMGPILGLGFGMAMFDSAEIRRSITALVVGVVSAVVFTAVIVAASPLKESTAEIVARTRPTLFDLLVALFAALAGTYAIIRGRGETIVGVAIATALMPPLAVVGYGLATWNVPVLLGSSALFVTNLVTIALAAMIMARMYGFGHRLSAKQSWTQSVVLLLLFVAMSVPLALSLRRIAGESITGAQVRDTLAQRFGTNARVTQLEIDFDAEPMTVRAVLITARDQVKSTDALRGELEQVLGRDVDLRVDQVLLAAGATAIEAQRAELRAASEANAQAQAQARATDQAIAQSVAVAAGIPMDRVTIDHDRRRASAVASPLAGAQLSTYYALERRAGRMASGWQVSLVPPLTPFPAITFAEDAPALDARGREAVLVTAWAARRWNITTLAVPGLEATAPDVAAPATGSTPTPASTSATTETPDPPAISALRARAISALLEQQGIRAVPAPATEGDIVLTPATTEIPLP